MLSVDGGSCTLDSDDGSGGQTLDAEADWAASTHRCVTGVHCTQEIR